VANTYLSRAGLWFAIVVWGASFVAARIVLYPQTADAVVLSPVVLAACRFSIASLFFLGPVLSAGLRGRLTIGHLWKMAVLGQTSFSLYFWLQYVGVQGTNASIASILVVGLIPLSTALVARVVGSEKLDGLKLAALILGFAGVPLIVLRGHSAVLSLNSGFLFGSLCLIANAFLWAFNSTFSKQWMRDEGLSPVLLTGGSMISGALGLILASLIFPHAGDWRDVARLDPTEWAALAFLSLVCSVVAYFLYNFALTKVPASQAAFYIYFEPVVAVALGMSMLGERLNALMILGMAMVAVSALIMNHASKTAAPAPAPAREAPALGSSVHRAVND